MLSPAARLTGAASESASSARDKVFARLPWDPVLHVTVITAISGPGVVRLREQSTPKIGPENYSGCAGPTQAWVSRVGRPPSARAPPSGGALLV